MRPPKIPKLFNILDMQHPSDAFMKLYLFKNLYSLKYYGCTSFDFLKDGLIDRIWKQSTIDTCLFTKSGILLIVYFDYAILLLLSKSKIRYEIKSLQEHFDLTDYS